MNVNAISDAYHIHYEENRLWEQTTWLGVPCWKLPNDAWILQELIYKCQPDYIIETGTGHGGAALFYASIMELIGWGRVITIDVEDRVEYSSKCSHVHNRITYLHGSSISPEIYEQVLNLCPSRKNIVVLDSWHSFDHVSEEMFLYSELVGKDYYMIVEDTHVSSHPVDWSWGEGPMEAVKQFLADNPLFVVDEDCEKLHMTFNPGGFLKRIQE